MCKFKNRDFYYGAPIKMMCDAGKAPKQLKSQDRSVPAYWLADERGGKGQVYLMQYVQANKNPSKGYDSWTHQFDDKRIRRMTELHEQGYDVYSALIGLAEHGDQEIVYLGYKDVMDCLGVDRGTMGQRSVTVRREPGKRSLSVYGSGRSDLNAISLRRNAVPFG